MKTRRGLGLLRTTTLALTAACVMLPLTGAPTLAASPVDRHDWTIGLATRVGRASVELNGGPGELDWSRGASPEFRAARMLGDHWSIGLQNRQWLNEGGLAGYKVRGNVQNLGLQLTAYPGSTTNLASGLFVQAGYGFAHGRLSALEPYAGGSNEWGETYEVLDKHDAEGWGASAGLGYEFRIARNFAAGASTTYNYLKFDDEIFDRVEFFSSGLNLNWYF